MIQYLTTEKWQFKEYPLDARQLTDLDKTSWHDIAMPSSIYSSLIASGQIDKHIFYSNPQNYGWVSDKPWIYRTAFQVDKQFLDSGNKYFLNLDRIDTVSSIWLNGKLIGKTDNCFICQRFDISELLLNGTNTVMIKFESPVESAKKIMDRYTIFKGFLNPYRVYLRKAQFSFGWDFSPALPGCGLYGDIWIETAKAARIENIHIRAIEANEHYADLKISVYLERFAKTKLECLININGYGFTRNEILVFGEKEKEKQNSIIVRIDRPFLWQPIGYGVQCFYDITAELICKSERIDEKHEKYGIKTVKVDKSKDDTGRNFGFEVNNQKIYIRGANWVPLSIRPDDVDDNKYEQMIKNAVDAGFNMLRVWGGGWYEKDVFYQLCDKYGLLVWQDFPFACGDYPNKDWFYEQVRAEAEYNVKRLRNRSCMAIWCGNNECQWMHSNLGATNGRKMYGKDIFDKLLLETVRELDPDKEYIPTTPFGNEKDYNAPSEGTVHNWGVWSGNKPVIDYLFGDVPRFVTEFGFQSLPHIKTVNYLIDSENLQVGDFDIEKLNYQVGGNSKLYRYVFDNFRPTADIETFTYLSQLTQARAAKLYIEHLRANNDINRGVMFWQFNEAFPAISWSAIDYFGMKKAIYYYAKRFYAPLLICLCQQIEKDSDTMKFNTRGMSIVIVNDYGKSRALQLVCKVLTFTGELIDSMDLPLTVSANSKSIPVQLPKSFIFPKEPCNSFITVQLQQDGNVIAENTYLYCEDKYLKLPRADFDFDTKIVDEKTIITIKSRNFIKDLAVFVKGHIQPETNFIDILAQTERQIIFPAKLDSETLESIRFLSIHNKP